MNVTQSVSLVNRIDREVKQNGFKMVAVALAQVAYRKATFFRIELRDDVTACRWDIMAKALFTAADAIPVEKLNETELDKNYATA